MSTSDTSVRGWIFNLQRFSIHDGPGIRTTVFLKGCPLRCLWCDNPESQRLEPQIVFWKERCIGCNACLMVCRRSAIHAAPEGSKRVLEERCDLCGLCLAECYAGALEQIGRLVTVDEVVAQVAEDRLFYERSGGGVTLSGGEPLSQPDFSLGILRGCQENSISTAIETCGHAPWDAWRRLLPYLDLILFDLKEVDPLQHKRAVGVTNDLILDNLRRLAQSGKHLIVRRPVIPGYTDNPAGIHALGRLLQEIGSIREIHLLPYHRFGQGKYERLGRSYPMGDAPSLAEEQVFALREILTPYGFQVRIGG